MIRNAFDVMAANSRIRVVNADIMDGVLTVVGWSLNYFNYFGTVLELPNN